ncbi:TIGR03085 family metal-binding protein [Rhodococcus sp. 1168]|uniref:TIGR03085 family metal-binding protein n=1 Tax=Rhodococcus sp. 1168 TaxID=2018041 RepID=UPI000A0C6F5F|nr:TIGR03085 family metal-binding protein [Rhodococcus sp. 1168]ORI18619.1 TIGR03085 family protein [Rhodococcus sp. 1168]
MSLAQDERAALVHTLEELGEDTPTLCGGWTGRDLAAHLVVRERRLDAAPGILIPFLAGYTEKIQSQVAARPFGQLVEEIRTGPPIWSPFKILDPLINVGEMFVHHEDLRRAQPEWSPRTLPRAMEDKLFSTVGLIGRKSYRRAPVGVELRTTDGRSVTVKKSSRGQVTLIGPPSELLLHAFGRSAVRLEKEGDPRDIEALDALDRSL